jgi:hypothetical protein
LIKTLTNGLLVERRARHAPLLRLIFNRELCLASFDNNRHYQDNPVKNVLTMGRLEDAKRLINIVIKIILLVINTKCI